MNIREVDEKQERYETKIVTASRVRLLCKTFAAAFTTPQLCLNSGHWAEDLGYRWMARIQKVAWQQSLRILTLASTIY